MQEHSVVLRGKRRHLLVSCTQVRGPSGEVEQIMALVQDTTEVRELEGSLRQAKKMVALGQLATGIAHEINNPLAVVSSSTEILAEFAEEQAAEGAPGAALLERHLKKIGESVFRCKGIIEDLLGFARREAGPLEEVLLNELLDESLRLAREHATLRGVALVADYALEDSSLISSEYDRHAVPFWVRTRPRELRQVFLNLLFNAVDASEEGGQITITIEREGSALVTTVADEGAGIAPEHLERIFEPFFTTKPVGAGTGLGLYLSHQLVTSLGGALSVESAVGEGAAFRVALPADSTSGLPRRLKVMT